MKRNRILLIITAIVIVVMVVFLCKSSDVYKSVFNGQVSPGNSYILDNVKHNSIHNLQKPERKLSDKFVKKLKEIYVDVRDALDEQNIPTWLAGGTLIGAVRHQGFIPWDDDIDLFTRLENYDKVVETLKKNPKYKITYLHNIVSSVTTDSSIKVYYKDAKDGSPPFIDIFFMKQIGDTLGKCTDVKCTSVAPKETFIISDIFPLKKIKFEDTWAYIPNNTEQLIKKQYGENVLTTPSVYPPHSIYTWTAFPFSKELYENTDTHKSDTENSCNSDYSFLH